MIVTAEGRAPLTEVAGDRSRTLKHLQRARIVLHSGERLPVLEVSRCVGVSRPAVRRWQRRLAEDGVDSLLRDKTQPPGKPPLPAATVAKGLELTCQPPPGEVTHWTGRAMAKAVGISLRAVQRLWQARRLQPRRNPDLPKRSNDPALREPQGRPFTKLAEARATGRPARHSPICSTGGESTSLR